jgi:hypothetical protein
MPTISTSNEGAEGGFSSPPPADRGYVSSAIHAAIASQGEVVIQPTQPQDHRLTGVASPDATTSSPPTICLASSSRLSSLSGAIESGA